MVLEERRPIILDPLVLSPVALIIFGHETMQRRNEALLKIQPILNDAVKQHLLKTQPNNWLKMHGYPMRRRH